MRSLRAFRLCCDFKGCDDDDDGMDVMVGVAVVGEVVVVAVAM